MFRRSSAILLSLSFVAISASNLRAQELTTDAERSWRELRNSKDVKRKLLADRWRNVTRLQEWSDATGKFKTSAKYVEHDPQLAWVKLRVIKGTGSERVVKDLQIPLEKLSKSAQSRVRQIATLSEKVATAIEEEKKAEEEKKEGAAGEGGGMMEESRGGPGEMEGGMAGMDVSDPATETRGGMIEESRSSEAASPPPVTNNGPPLPAARAPLPTATMGPATASNAASANDDRASADAESAAPVSSDTTAFQHPTSAEELKAAFEKAFGSGDKETLEKLFYWGSVGPEMRQHTYVSLIDDVGAQLLRCELQTLPDGENFPDYTIDSTTYFDLEYETESAGRQMRWPYGEIEGKFYLAAVNPTQRR